MLRGGERVGLDRAHPGAMSAGEMGSLDETLSAMLANDQGYSSTLASVLASSNSGTRADEGVFALQQRSETFHRAGGLAGTSRVSAATHSGVAQWSFGRDQKWVLDGNTNEALEAPPSSNTVVNPPAAGGGLQRYHSAPSTFLECLADFSDDAFAHVNEKDSDLLDSFFADNLATINERGAQPMDTDPPKVVSVSATTSLNEYEQFVATQSRSSSSLSPSPHPSGSKLAELRPDHGHGGFSTPDAWGARSRPTRMNLLRQNSTSGDFLAAVQDSLEPPGITSPVFKMPSFSRDESSSNITGATSERDNGVQSGNRLRSTELTTEVPGWLGSSSLRVRVGDPTSPMTSKLGLIRHSSLPSASRPFSPTMELDDLAEFSGTVPCKTRANRGFATHPRSIAERVRRTKISERMKKLQELVPNMDRQTNTADMLDEAVEYVKHLQLQVQELSTTVVQLKERLVHCS